MAWCVTRHGCFRRAHRRHNNPLIPQGERANAKGGDYTTRKRRSLRSKHRLNNPDPCSVSVWRVEVGSTIPSLGEESISVYSCASAPLNYHEHLLCDEPLTQNPSTQTDAPLPTGASPQLPATAFTNAVSRTAMHSHVPISPFPSLEKHSQDIPITGIPVAERRSLRQEGLFAAGQPSLPIPCFQPLQIWADPGLDSPSPFSSDSCATPPVNPSHIATRPCNDPTNPTRVSQYPPKIHWKQTAKSSAADGTGAPDS